MPKSFPTGKYELPLWEKDYIVVGIDEVGRGALAGPLGVGAVVFEIPNSQLTLQEIENNGINDSKKLSAKKRNECAAFIKKYALFTSTVHMEARFINEKGISKAFESGVQLLVDRCLHVFHNRKLFILIDGNFNLDIKGIKHTQIRSIIAGDGKVLSIAAASIIAKVARDSYMKDLSAEFPEYGFEKHVGYGTLSHRNALVKYGPTPVHRTLFIRKIMNRMP